MSATRLNPLDASWLYAESRDTPMHVGALMPFRQPKGAASDFPRALMADWRKQREFAAPCHRRVRLPILKRSSIRGSRTTRLTLRRTGVTPRCPSPAASANSAG